MASLNNYLHDFHRLLSLVETRHTLNPEQQRFVDDYRALSEEAQAAYLKMLSQKNENFRHTTLERSAVEELQAEGFCAIEEKSILQLRTRVGAEILELFFGRRKQALNLYTLHRYTQEEVIRPPEFIWPSHPEETYAVVDVETTGGSAEYHRVTEIGAVKIRGGQIVDEFSTLVHPGRTIPPHITRITGITDEMVANAPSFEKIAVQFLEFTKDSIFVAHNVRFDYSFILGEYRRLEIHFEREILCTCSGMRRSFPGMSSYGLKNLSRLFSISLEQHHRALFDARAAAELLLLMTGQSKGAW